MFGKILAGLLTGGIPVLTDVDAAMAEFKKDPNNAAKALTVAKAVLAVTEVLTPLFALL
jgi:hypothetical protein